MKAWLIVCKGQLQVQVTFELRMCCLRITCALLPITLLSFKSCWIGCIGMHSGRASPGLIINVSKSEFVHFKSKGNNVHAFTLGGAQLVCAEPFKYLGRGKGVPPSEDQAEHDDIPTN
eukprot:1160568-Pelagomonas_calceolata.AAC.1